MFNTFTPKVSKENIEEFGKLIDYHNLKLVEAKCRKYSIIDDEETDSNSNQFHNDSLISNKFGSALKSNEASTVQSELKLHEEDYEKCYLSPQRLSSHFNTLNNLDHSWSLDKKSKQENPFRNRIAKSKLNFNLVPNESNSSSGLLTEIKQGIKHSSLLDVTTKLDSNETNNQNQLIFNNGKRKNTFN